MIIESMRPALAAAIPLLAAGLILVFGNRVKPNARETVTLIAAVSMAGAIFTMVPEVLAGNRYVSDLWQLADGLTLSLRTDAAAVRFRLRKRRSSGISWRRPLRHGCSSGAGTGWIQGRRCPAGAGTGLTCS